MTPMALDTAGLLDRFHSVLVGEIRSNRPDLEEGSFTVAEIYQELVPYRTHRGRLGVEMNGDYEHVLLMLLAGEGDFLVLESEEALGELRSELKSSNPNTGLYREYAAAEVHLNRAMVPDPEDGPDPEEARVDDAGPDRPADPEESGEPVDVDLLAPSGTDDAEMGGPETVDAAEPPLPVESVDDDETGALDPVADSAAVCRACKVTLPDRDGVVFCPYCGSDLRVIECAACGETLEPNWRFCVACGAEVDAD